MDNFFFTCIGRVNSKADLMLLLKKVLQKVGKGLDIQFI